METEHLIYIIIGCKFAPISSWRVYMAQKDLCYTITRLHIWCWHSSRSFETNCSSQSKYVGVNAWLNSKLLSCDISEHKQTVKSSTIKIWQSIRLHCGSQSAGGHILDFNAIHLVKDARIFSKGWIILWKIISWNLWYLLLTTVIFRMPMKICLLP